MTATPVIFAMANLERQQRAISCVALAPALSYAGTAADPTSLFGLAGTYPQAILLTDVELALSVLPLLAVLRRTGAEHKLVVWPANTTDPRLGALKSGGATVLPAAASDRDLLKALTNQEEPAEEPAETFTPVAPGTLAANTVRLVTCYSPKGGVGTSTLAQSLALHVARRGISTLLIDFALYGATAVTLRLKQAGSGLGLLMSAIERDESFRTTSEFPQVLGKAIQRYTFPGGALDLLLAAPPSKMERLRLEDAEALLTACRNAYQFVVVDASTELSERNMAALLHADRILISATPDVASGWALFEAKEVFEALRVPAEKVGLVVQRSRLDLRFSIGELSQASGFRQVGEYPDEFRAVQTAINEGIPPLLRVRAIEAATAELAGRLIPGLAPQGRQKGWRWIG